MPARMSCPWFVGRYEELQLLSTALDEVVAGASVTALVGRDCRLGRIHPANELLTPELIGKMSLGLDPDEQPRWG